MTKIENSDTGRAARHVPDFLSRDGRPSHPWKLDPTRPVPVFQYRYGRRSAVKKVSWKLPFYTFKIWAEWYHSRSFFLARVWRTGALRPPAIPGPKKRNVNGSFRSNFKGIEWNFHDTFLTTQCDQTVKWSADKKKCWKINENTTKMRFWSVSDIRTKIFGQKKCYKNYIKLGKNKKMTKNTKKVEEMKKKLKKMKINWKKMKKKMMKCEKNEK